MTENRETNKYTNSNPQQPNFWKGVFGGIVGSIMVVALVVFVAFSSPSQMQQAFSQEDQTETPANPSLSDFEETVISAIDQSSEAVVSVGNMQVVMSGQNGMQGMYNGSQNGIELPGETENLQMVSQGSGVIYKVDGETAYIVTNHHVVNGSQALEIRLEDGTIVDGELVGSDEMSDLAVLTIDAANVTTTIEFADSDQLQVGSLALAIGSPLSSDFATSVTQGIVSGLQRSIPIDLDGDYREDWNMTLLQTDAAINPGNSGGALVNSSGQLIGINSSKFAATGIEGMGFAIPSNDVQEIISQLETSGEVVRPVLGVSTLDVELLSENSRVNVLGLAADFTSGVVVMEVVPNSSAATGGVEEYDVITAIDGNEIVTYTDLRQELYRHKVGDSIEVTVLRKGEETQLTVTLEAISSEGGSILN